eukprot:CAMPEP_0114255486 /NCGR_PEP_ID=MMETSP0058-20121206/17587_1 /TAXON_ID=36894 /ORGANISM="Pyramimonas parkeae, CCMP726" /LENGTH=393 /DNA_ID=CAMNT_0001369873 /DNA_START=125 /DNA_END=1306 /DNA_ORIENTATION=-
MPYPPPSPAPPIPPPRAPDVFQQLKDEIPHYNQPLDRNFALGIPSPPSPMYPSNYAYNAHVDDEKRKSYVNKALKNGHWSEDISDWFRVGVTDFVHLTVQVYGINGSKHQAMRKDITIALFGDVVPKTVHNFKVLVTGEHGFGYKDTIFFKVVRDVFVQGGDVSTMRHGQHLGEEGQGRSVYAGPEGAFPDENHHLNHTGPGVVSMAPAAPDENKSQFLITLKAAPELDGKHVVFGRVTQGMEVVQAMNWMALDGTRPVGFSQARIVACGVFSCGKNPPTHHFRHDRRYANHEKNSSCHHKHPDARATEPNRKAKPKQPKLPSYFGYLPKQDQKQILKKMRKGPRAAHEPGPVVSHEQVAHTIEKAKKKEAKAAKKIAKIARKVGPVISVKAK